LRHACNAVGVALKGLSRLAAFAILLRKGKVAARKKRGESEGALVAAAQVASRVRENRTLMGVSVRRGSVAEVVGR
jgi:hypothetical protein